MKKVLLSIALMLLCVFGLVACGSDVSKEDLEAGKEYLEGVFRTSKPIQNDDYEIINKTNGNGVVFEITWSIEFISGNEEDITLEKGISKTKVVVNEKSEVEAKYYLVATFGEGKNTIQVKFEKIKEAYVPVAEMTWDQVMAAEKGDKIMGKGVVTAVAPQNGKINFFMQNEQGGYYVYNYTETDDTKGKIVVGATVTATGTKDVYNGLTEIKDAMVEIHADAIKTVEPKDVTEIFAKAANAKDASLLRLEGQYVTVKGVEMVDITSEGKYLNFKIGNVATYIYVSSSFNFATTEECEALKEKVVKGRTATITGLVAQYNGTVQIYPINADTIVLDKLPELNDAEKVADAEAKVKALAENKVVSDLKLFTTTDYEGVTVVWASANEELITKEGKLVKYPVEDTKVELTATIKAGAETKEVKVEVTVAGLEKITIAEANKLFEEKKTVWVEGKIVATYNKGQGSFIADETGVMYVYTTLPEGYAVGDSVKIIGNLTVWENSGKEYTRQLKIVSIEKLDTAVEVLEPTRVDLAAVANKFGADQEGHKMTAEEKAMAISSKYYGGLYEFTGYVVTHAFGEYTNYGLAVEAEGTTFVLYQYQNDYQDEFKALVGKKVTIVAPMYGYASQYGWRIGTYLSVTEEAAPALPTTTDTCAAAKAAAANTEVTLIGQVIAVYENNGFYLKDATGGIYVYVKGDTSAYAVGNIVKVTGKTGNYNGPQIGNAGLKVEVLQLAEFEANPTTLTTEEFVALTGTELANYGKEVTVVGTVVKNGDYVNLKINDDFTSNLYLSAAQKAALAEYANKQVTFTGVLYSKKDPYAFNMLMISFEPVAE